MKRRRTKEQNTASRPDGFVPFSVNHSLPNPAYGLGAERRRINPEPQQILQAPPEPEKRKRRWGKIFKRTFLTVVLLAIIGGGWVTWKFVSNEVKVFGWDGLWSLIHPGPLNNQNGRVNILLAGDSVGRTDGGGGQQLTDSIMIVSIDTQNHTAFFLSVPRDMYVDIPGFASSKINAAAEDGASAYGSHPEYDANGMGLLSQVVSQKMGITVDYYALVDYAAFENAVDAVGGISVNIQSSDSRGLYDPSVTSPTDSRPLVDLTNGVHKLNGQEALGLARARGDSAGSYGYGQSDFTRTQNQREMLIAIEDKAVTAGVLSNPIKLGNLFDSFGSNIETDMTLGNARELYNVFKKIPSASIASESLNSANGHDLLTGKVIKGQDVLVPAAGTGDFSAIQAFVAQLSGQ